MRHIHLSYWSCERCRAPGGAQLCRQQAVRRLLCATIHHGAHIWLFGVQWVGRREKVVETDHTTRMPCGRPIDMWESTTTMVCDSFNGWCANKRPANGICWRCWCCSTMLDVSAMYIQICCGSLRWGWGWEAPERNVCQDTWTESGSPSLSVDCGCVPYYKHVLWTLSVCGHAPWKTAHTHTQQT